MFNILENVRNVTNFWRFCNKITYPVKNFSGDFVVISFDVYLKTEFLKIEENSEKN